MAEADDVRTFKIVLVGDGSAGKTSIINQYTQEHFGKAYRQTVGLDFYLKRLVLPGERNVTLQIWDIGGQSLGGKMLPNYLESAEAILLVYDVTNQSSFENVEDWLRVTKKHLEGRASPRFYLVGNKADLTHLQAVKVTAHKAFQEQHCEAGFFVCAKTGERIELCFRQVVADLTGVKMTREEAARMSSKVKQAEILEYGKAEGAVSTAPAPKTPKRATNKRGGAGGRASAKSSSICLLQ